MLSGRAGQRIRSFKALRSLHPHLPILACARPGNGNSPAPSSVGKSVFDLRSNVPAQLRIAEILQLDGHSHSAHFIARSTARPWCKTVKAKYGGLRRASCAWFFTIGVENRAATKKIGGDYKDARGSEKNRLCGTICPEMEKAATLVMLQPSAPAREPKAWMHAPSQPLMRSPLSRFQTPAPPRKSQPVFSGLDALQVTLLSRPLSLLQIGKFLFRQSFQPSTSNKLNNWLINVNAKSGKNILDKSHRFAHY